MATAAATLDPQTREQARLALEKERQLQIMRAQLDQLERVREARKQQAKMELASELERLERVKEELVLKREVRLIHRKQKMGELKAEMEENNRRLAEITGRLQQLKLRHEMAEIGRAKAALAAGGAGAPPPPPPAAAAAAAAAAGAGATMDELARREAELQEEMGPQRQAQRKEAYLKAAREAELLNYDGGYPDFAVATERWPGKSVEICVTTLAGESGLDLTGSWPGTKEAAPLLVRENPLSKGTCRIAYPAVLNGRRMVFKRLIFEEGDKAIVTELSETVRMHLIGQSCAEKFNAALAAVWKKKPKKGAPLRIRFANAFVVKMIGLYPPPLYGNLEEWLDGSFEKWNNNSDYVNDKEEAIQAFSHFTWSSSRGEILIVDMQGVKKDEEYFCTDPAIHCAKNTMQFGITNCGEQGYMDFFSNHKCNKFCKALKLTPHPAQKK